MNLLDGPDANTYEIAALVAMLEGILVGGVAVFSILYGLLTVGGLPRTAILVSTSLVIVSGIGLAIGFAQNRSRRPQIATLTLLCALVAPCCTILSAAKLNFNVLALIGPGVLLFVLSCVKLIQLRNAPR